MIYGRNDLINNGKFKNKTMNTTEKIKNFFNSKLIKETKEVENEWNDEPKLRISKTVQPDERLPFNETFLNAYKYLNNKI